MRQCVRLSLALGLLTLSSVACTAQEKVTLTYKATKGQVVRYKSSANLNLDFGGMKIELETKQVEKTTVTNVAANGDITKEATIESVEMTMNGEKRPAPDGAKDKTTTTVIHPDGTLVSLKSTGEEGPEGKVGVRLNSGTHPIYSTKPVGVGDKWTYEIKADTDLGTEKGKGDVEVLAFEKMAGTDTIKLKVSYKESGHDPALSISGTVWADKVSGDIVHSELDVENLQFGGEQGPMVTGKFKEELSEGKVFLGSVGWRSSRSRRQDGRQNRPEAGCKARRQAGTQKRQDD